jgi:hypothetical protein
MLQVEKESKLMQRPDKVLLENDWPLLQKSFSLFLPFGKSSKNQTWKRENYVSKRYKIDINKDKVRRRKNWRIKHFYFC